MKPMNPETDKLVLQAKLRIRAHEVVNKYMQSADPKPIGSKSELAELVYNALVEASMLGMKAAVHGLYELTGQSSKPDSADGQSGSPDEPF